MDGRSELRIAAAPFTAAAPARPRRALLVAGMHRSGTSLLAHLLHVLGAALPEALVAPTFDNPLGFWEPASLVAIHDAALDALGRSWDDPRPIDPAWFRSRAAFAFVERIVAAIEVEYGAAPLLLIKDPRLCRLLPLMLAALDMLDIEPLVILPLRPFAEVAESLALRDAMPPAHAELLWVRSVLEAELVSRSCVRGWIGLDHLLGDWHGALAALGAALGIDWDDAPPDIAAAVAHVIKPRLRHGTDARLDPSHWLAAGVWEAAQRALEADDAATRARFDMLRAALADFDRMAGYLLETQQAQHIAACEALYRSTSWRVTAPLRALKRVI